MTNKKRFLVAMAVLGCVACVFCAFVCSRFAPRCVREQRETVCADARTIVAAIRYLATPELPDFRGNQEKSDTLMTPQTAQPPRRTIANTNIASLAGSNHSISLPLAATVRG